MNSHQSFNPENTTTTITPNTGLHVSDVSNQPELTNNFIPTGITVTLNLPIVYQASKPFLNINLNGLQIIGNTQAAVSSYENNIRNFIPVTFEPTWFATGAGTITLAETGHPVYSMMRSHRIMDGNVQVAIRMSSNTSQSGNLFLTRRTGLMRNWKIPGDVYNGNQWVNADSNIEDFGTETFALSDLSLNRTISIKTSNTRPEKMDIHKLINDIALATGSSTGPTSVKSSAFREQYTEDIISLGILTNLPTSDVNQLTMYFFMDYSQVTFEFPLLMQVYTPPSFVTTPYIDLTAYYSGVPLGRALEDNNQ